MAVENWPLAVRAVHAQSRSAPATSGSAQNQAKAN